MHAHNARFLHARIFRLIPHFSLTPTSSSPLVSFPRTLSPTYGIVRHGYVSLGAIFIKVRDRGGNREQRLHSEAFRLDVETGIGGGAGGLFFHPILVSFIPRLSPLFYPATPIISALPLPPRQKYAINFTRPFFPQRAGHFEERNNLCTAHVQYLGRWRCV